MGYNGCIDIMAYSISLKDKIIRSRKKGYSLSELNLRFAVSKGILSNWLRNISLSKKAKQRLLTKIKNGQLVSAINKKEKTKKELDVYFQDSVRDVEKLKIDKNLAKIICALLYWCEGDKNFYSAVRFTNSDDNLIRTFLNLLRKSFQLDESKFRVCVHLHNYHNTEKQLKFWSKVTDIPLSKFIRPYKKKNTGKRTREGYNGCVSVRYHDVKIARQLLMTAKAFFGRY